MGHRFFMNRMSPDGTSTIDETATRSTVGFQDSHDLSGPQIQVMDANGDGFTDMINGGTGEVLINEGQGDWSRVESLWSGTGGTPDLAGDFDAGDGELRTVRFLDYDGDRRIDFIRSSGAGMANTTVVYENLGGGGFASVDVDPIGAGFESDSLELNDMNGDGLLDAVQVMTGSVRYRLNLGFGRWDDWVEITGFTFSDQQRIEAELEDLNGDALADLVLVEGDTVRYWLNRNAAGFDPEEQIRTGDVVGELPARDANTVMLFADMNGSGSSDVVWISGTGDVTYLEIFPVRPNLLTRIENGIGAVTDVAYQSSVREQAEDGMGSWPYPLPHPMTVVTAVDEYDLLTNVHEITEMSYAFGFYDGVEAQFRGFEEVEVLRVGDESQAEALTIETYDIGRMDVYRNGLLTQREVFQDGESLLYDETEWGECEVYGIPDSGLLFDVRYICRLSHVQELREGGDMSDDVRTEMRYAYNDFGQVVLQESLGVTSIGGMGCEACERDPEVQGAPCGAMCIGDEQYESTAYTHPDDNIDEWLVLPYRTRTYGRADVDGEPLGEVYSESITYYDGEPFEGLDAGLVTAGLVTRTTERINVGEVVEMERNRYDEHGNLVETIGPLGEIDGTTHRRLYTYDDDGLDLIRTEILLENEDGPYRLVRETRSDPLWGSPSLASSWVRVRGGDALDTRDDTFFTYDEFGRLLSRTLPGDAPGMPTEVYEYDLGSPVSRITTRGRSEPGGPLDREEVRCDDGWGRTVQTRQLVESGRYLVTGFSVYNQGGSEREIWQAYEGTTSDCDTTPPDGVPSTTSEYDALGRLTRTVYPAIGGGESPETVTEYLPLVEVIYDEEDMRSGGDHANTPTIRIHDGLSRLVSVQNLLTETSGPVWHFTYDELGHLRGYDGPEGTFHEQTSDFLGRVLTVDNPDTGTITQEYDVAGNLIARTDARGATTAWEFDGANRVLAEYEEGNEAATRIDYTYDFADECPVDRCTNPSGSVVSISYPFGDDRASEHYGYDPRERMTWVGRQIDGFVYEIETRYDNGGRVVGNTFPGGYDFDFEIDLASRITGIPGYLDEIAYDERGRIEAIEYANGSSLVYGYDERLQLESLTASDEDGEAILAYDYRRDHVGNLTEVFDNRADDGDPMSSASYTYDSMYRLIEASLDPDRADHAEVLAYAYSETDNLLSVASSLGDDSNRHVGDLTYGQDAGPHAVTAAGDLTMGYDPAGNMTRRGTHRYDYDFRGRMVGASEGSRTLATVRYGATDQRIFREEGGRETVYVAPDFEVRDGIGIIYLRIDDTRLVEIEVRDLASAVLTDVAPATGPDDAIVPEPDGATAGDAWVAQAHRIGVFERRWIGSDPVETLLASSVARTLADGEADEVRFLYPNHQNSLAAVADADGQLLERYEYTTRSEWCGTPAATTRGLHRYGRGRLHRPGVLRLPLPRPVDRPLDADRPDVPHAGGGGVGRQSPGGHRAVRVCAEQSREPRRH